MKVEIDVPEFSGFEFVGYKAPEQGEWYEDRGVLVEGRDHVRHLTYRKVVKYREPTQADVGKMVEVRDSETQRWRELELLLVTPSYDYPYVTSDAGKNNHVPWRHARIVDDGAAIRQPREVWVNMYPDQSIGSAAMTKERAIAFRGGKGETVHFREVME